MYQFLSIQYYAWLFGIIANLIEKKI